MDAFATDDDVIGVSAPLSSDQSAVVDGLLAQASTRLRGWGRERGVDIDALIEDDPLLQQIAKDAVVNATKRELGMIDGFTEITVAIDDYRETKRRPDSRAASSLYIDPADLVGLLPARKRRRFGTLRLGSAL